ncbi:MAG: class I SAM-dependent methyltransferase [Acidobacteria bacterium]|nr:class I SAM-dependent methyltransferase [Acidobacteriota bacterium]
MSHEKGSAEELARLKREREGADRVYNDALTALDAAILKLRELPHPPPAYDEHQITPLNERWELLPLKPAEGAGWLRRLRAHVWAMVAPLFERQQAFNSALVDHVNRNIATHRETTRAVESTVAMFREELQGLIHFQTMLILYAQQITPYIDTKDREVAGLMHGLAAGLSGLSDELQKRWESMGARERRYESQVSDVRSTLSVMQRATQTLKRELEERRGTDPQSPVTDPRSPDLNSYKYVGFEDQFRGSQTEIRDRVEAYVPYFKGASDVLDIGCGRGEFLDLLRQHGISARGVDLNDEMAAVCRERGLEATANDALSYLLAQPDGSLGGLFAAQVVEHLEPDYLMRLLEAAYHKLRPGSKIILETINPACWFAFFSSYIRDITHVQPLHPDTLQYLLVASGFQRVDVRYSAPFPEESKLQPIPVTAGQAAGMEAVVNENVKKLNGLLFTYLDYAAIGERM